MVLVFCGGHRGVLMGRGCKECENGEKTKSAFHGTGLSWF